MNRKQLFKNTKALVMGLGVHGGGVATAKWLVRNGAIVTATDKRTAKELAPSISALRGYRVNYILGEHREQDFTDNDLIVVNPGVPKESAYLRLAKKSGKRLENDTSLFFAHTKNPIIGVTGTRGKSSTTTWIAALLKRKYPKVRPSGNTPENALLKEFDRIVSDKKLPVVAELSSWQLEFLPVSKRAPHIAVITNLFQDHLNRYSGMKEYADAKANIFKFQNENDHIILNRDNPWASYFSKKRRQSKLHYVTTKILPKRYDGAYIHDQHIWVRTGEREHRMMNIKNFVEQYGEHNLENLLCAILAIYIFDPTISFTEKDILKLQPPRFRQQIIAKYKGVEIVNDSCATSPDGTVAAIERFVKKGKIVLIAGGTDKQLDMGILGTRINGAPEQIIPVLLEGSATKQLCQYLSKENQQALNLHSTLEACVKEAKRLADSDKLVRTILFSPGAASFEKFMHEFDRGEQFSGLTNEYFL